MMLVHLFSLIRVCSKDGEIILRDTDVVQGNHVQKVDESLQWPHSLASWVCLQLSLSKVFCSVLIASLWALIILKNLQSVILAVWYDMSLPLVCVIKVAFFAKALAILLPVMSQWPELHYKTIILFLL
jgi:hypothetical protein